MPLTFTTAPVATLQALTSALQHGATQLIPVGTKLYFVVIEQVGAAPGNKLRVYETTDFVTWNLAAQYAGGVGLDVSQDCPCCLVGTVIYILGVDTNAPVNLIMHRFDTGTNAFLADSPLGPVQGGAGQQLWSLSPFNNGTILVSSTVSTPHLTLQLYNTAANTWGAVTNVTADSSQPLQQIHDSISDFAFVFYEKAATREVRCLTVTNALVFSDVTVSTWPAPGPFPATALGMPAISNGEIVLPMRQFKVGPPFLYAARSPVQAVPVFTTDLVEDTSTLPVNSQVQAYDQLAGPGYFAIDVSGVLYMFYAIDNGELDSALSQAWLYYRSSTGPGVWSAPTIAFTGPVPSELAIPYGAPVGTSNPTILVGTFNPVTYPAIASLSNFILYSAPAPAPSKGTTIYTGFAPVPLPDASIVCPKGLLNRSRTMRRVNNEC